MAYGLPAELIDAARLQRGILSSAQLRAAGPTWSLVRSRVSVGRWQRLYRGVYATFSGPPGREAALWAAVLACGPGAMLSYQAAAEVGGLTDKRSPLLHLTIPADRRIARPPGIVVHYSSRAEAARHPARTPPQTRVEETILDLVNVARSLDDACGWVTAGVGRRLTSEVRLRQALEQRGRLRWRAEVEELLSPAMTGVHSPLEWRYDRDVARPHGLPAGERQARARRDGHTEYRDRLYRTYGVALELDGQVAHPGDTRWADIRRDNAAAASQVATLRYGWADLATRPCAVAAEVARVLAGRGFTAARPCSAGCPVAAVTARRLTRTPGEHGPR
jgi:hypothetical protein